MEHPNPLLPSGASLEDRKRRKTKILFTVFGIVALHVIPISGLLLMQGCQPDLNSVAENEDPVPVNDEVPMLSTNDLYQEFETDDTRLSIPIETEIPPHELAVEPTISSEVILEEPGEREVASVSPNVDETLPPEGGRPEAPEPVVPSVETPVPNTESESGMELVEYRITAGDRLYSLSQEYGTTVNAILAANPGLDPRKLRVGKPISIPRNTVAPAPVAAPNGSMVSSSGARQYQVKRGDTLIRIAGEHGVSLSALRKANQLSSDLILVGQSLKIPVAEVASASGQ